MKYSSFFNYSVGLELFKTGLDPRCFALTVPMRWRQFYSCIYGCFFLFFFVLESTYLWQLVPSNKLWTTFCHKVFLLLVQLKLYFVIRVIRTFMAKPCFCCVGIIFSCLNNYWILKGLFKVKVNTCSDYFFSPCYFRLRMQYGWSLRSTGFWKDVSKLKLLFFL